MKKLEKKEIELFGLLTLFLGKYHNSVAIKGIDLMDRLIRSLENAHLSKANRKKIEAEIVGYLNKISVVGIPNWFERMLSGNLSIPDFLKKPFLKKAEDFHVQLLRTLVF